MTTALDLGSMFCVCVRKSTDATTVSKIRNCFLDIPSEHVSRLRLSNMNLIDTCDSTFVVGDDALVVANMLGREVRRPMAQGVLNPGEVKARTVLLSILDYLLGPPQEQNELCCISVPAPPVDQSWRLEYHTESAKALVSKIGYKAIVLNEATALLYASGKTTGIGISCGSGMINVAVVYKALPLHAFSLAKSGDWVDRSAADASGVPASRITSIKERGIDLADSYDSDDKDAVAKAALVVYYRALIQALLNTLQTELTKQRNLSLPEPLPIVIGGGSSLAKGFVEAMASLLDPMRQRFPVELGQVVAVSQVPDEVMTAVARGCLMEALAIP